MGLVSKLLGNNSRAPQANLPAVNTDMADGAVDTLGSVIRILGDAAFSIESDADLRHFQDLCAALATHVENGAAVAALDIPQSDAGRRDWGRVRRFVADRRRAEKTFVKSRLDDYRGVVDDLVSGLRQIAVRDKDTEKSVRSGLAAVEEAVDRQQLPQIRSALTQAISKVTETFAQQQQEYEEQLEQLKNRMSSLRQDLISAREEMKRDSLTDLFNRGAFDSAIRQAMNMFLMLQQPAALVMIDLDNFKQLNDSYGHSVGDEALREMSNCLARCFKRKTDFVARYGGDEFAVILPDTPAENCHMIVDRLLDSAKGIRVPGTPDEALVGCSVGYTNFAATDTIESLMNRADEALYAAKANGRGCAAFKIAEDAEN